MTNGDRIRQMSNEELANIMIDYCDWCIHSYAENCEHTCIKGIKAYLESEEE